MGKQLKVAAIVVIIYVIAVGVSVFSEILKKFPVANLICSIAFIFLVSLIVIEIRKGAE